MIQIITKEWEITKTYIYEVVLRDGLIKLDWKDFEMKARESRPAVAVKVDEANSLAELTFHAIGEVKKNVKRVLSCVMVVLSFKKGHDLMMDELGGMNESFSRLADENVDIMWGIQQIENINNNRSITVFAFEK